MIKKWFFLILSCLLFSFPLKGDKNAVVIDWYWGLESIDHAVYFNFNFTPEFRSRNFSFKLYLPLEVKSNWKINDNHWSSRYDIITKIDYLNYTNNFICFKILTLDNLSLGNGELVYDFSNGLFEPLLIKKGLISFIRIKSFQSTFVIDDLNDYDIFFFDLNYKYRSLKAGTLFTYDSDIFDPYAEKPVDRQRGISAWNGYVNYELLNKKKIILTFENDVIKHLKTYEYSGNFVFTSGFGLQWGSFLNFTSKMEYYGERTPGMILFNKFYDLERKEINDYIVEKASFGLLNRFDLYFKKYLNLSFFINKIERLMPSASIKLKALDDFPTKVRFSIEIFNRLNNKWYQVIGERERNSYVRWKSSVPLSKQLSLNFDYLKSFKYKNDDLNGLRQSILYLEFIF